MGATFSRFSQWSQALESLLNFQISECQWCSCLASYGCHDNTLFSIADALQVKKQKQGSLRASSKVWHKSCPQAQALQFILTTQRHRGTKSYFSGKKSRSQRS